MCQDSCSPATGDRQQSPAWLPVCTSVVHASPRAGDLVCPKVYLVRVPAELYLLKIHYLEGARGRM